MKTPWKLVDLTHILHPEVPCWDLSCGFHSPIKQDYKETDFRVMQIHMHAGIGTHMDAPSHCIDGGRNIADFNMQELCMPCYVIDVSARAHEDYIITCEDILQFESQHEAILPGACVFFYTGWEKLWASPNKYHNQHRFPSVSLAAATLLLERGALALGTDTLSADRPESGFVVHKAILGANGILLENVANLNSMPAIGAWVMVCPLRMRDLTESPVRLIGLCQ